MFIGRERHGTSPCDLRQLLGPGACRDRGARGLPRREHARKVGIAGREDTTSRGESRDAVEPGAQETRGHRLREQSRGRRQCAGPADVRGESGIDAETARRIAGDLVRGGAGRGRDQQSCGVWPGSFGQGVHTRMPWGSPRRPRAIDDEIATSCQGVEVGGVCRGGHAQQDSGAPEGMRGVDEGSRGQEPVDSGRIAQVRPGLPGQSGRGVDDDDIRIDRLHECGRLMREGRTHCRIGLPPACRGTGDRSRDREAATGGNRGDARDEEPGGVEVDDLTRARMSGGLGCSATGAAQAPCAP